MKRPFRKSYSEYRVCVRSMFKPRRMLIPLQFHLCQKQRKPGRRDQLLWQMCVYFSHSFVTLSVNAFCGAHVLAELLTN